MTCLYIAIYIIALFWTLFVCWGQVSTNLLLSTSLTLPKGLFVALPIIQSVALILPLIPLTIFLKNNTLKIIFRTWIATAVIGFIFAFLQIANQTSSQLRSIISIGLGIMCIFTIIVIGWIKYAKAYTDHLGSIQQPLGNIHIVLLYSSLFFYAWLAWGALGSPIDSILMLVNAIVFGILITLTLDLFLFLPLVNSTPKSIKSFILMGISTSIVLLIFASELGFPFGGMQILLMLSLPWTGWIALYLYERNFSVDKNPILAIMIIFSIAFSAPMLFIDPDELALVISSSRGEIGTWAIYASFVSFLVAFLFAVVMAILEQRHIRQVASPRPLPLNHIITTITILVSWAIGALLYFLVGQPGWYGEQLFIILKDQEVITQADTLENYQDRRELVYDTLVQNANDTQSELRSMFDRFDLNYQPYYLVNSIQVEGGPLLRLWLMTRPEVDRVLDSPHLRPLPEVLPTNYGSESLSSNLEWNLIQTQANLVWKDFKVTGKGVVIGQSDSGVQWDHPELFDSYRGRDGSHDYNWLDPWFNTTEPTDKSGHGTHTLGTIVGNNVGIAPDATWYACANLVRNLGNPAYYLDCLQFMLAPYPLDGNSFTDGDPSLGADIINNSWGCPDLEGCDADTFFYAVRNLRAAGIFVVASAGNDGPGCGTLKYPLANYPDLFSVGAIDKYGELAFFSSIGPAIADNRQSIKPDLIAPGVDILSSTPGNTYARYSGTSMAGPHVVGVVALIWSANPSLKGDIQKTTRILIESASPYNGSLPNCPGATKTPSNAVGYGMLNAYRAVELALQMK